MTPDEHQRERRAFWDGVCIALCPPPTPFPQMDADALLAERDKRFPAPSAAAPVEPVADAVPTETLLAAEYAQGWNKGHAEGVTHGMAHHAKELASLRQKARLWEAVASGKLKLVGDTASDPVTWWTSWRGQSCGYKATAAEAVEAAIAAGALK